MADRLLRHLLFNGESDVNGRATTDQSTDIVSDCWSWVSWAIEIGFISNYWKIGKSRKDLEFPKSPGGNSMMSGQTSNTVTSKNNQTPKKFWVNQHFSIKEIKKFFKDLQLAKDDEKMRVLIEFMSSKSENYKEGAWVGEKEIFSKDFGTKRSSCLFGVIDKTVNNLIKFADSNTCMPKTMENSFYINSTMTGNPIGIQDAGQKYRQSLGIPLGNQFELDRSRASQRKSGYEPKTPISN